MSKILQFNIRKARASQYQILEQLYRLYLHKRIGYFDQNEFNKISAEYLPSLKKCTIGALEDVIDKYILLPHDMPTLQELILNIK